MTTRFLLPALALLSLAEPAGAQEASSGPVVSASIDNGFGVMTPDRSNSLFVGGVLQERVEFRQRPGDLKTFSFDTRMVRPQLRGTVLRPWNEIRRLRSRTCRIPSWTKR